MTTYREPNAIKNVTDFTRLFWAYEGKVAHLPPRNICDLRVNLIQEELNELKEAINKKDLVEVADALADIQYVLSGTIIAFGLQDQFADIFDEVQRSNMSKACNTENEAEATVKHYEVNKNTEGYVKKKEGKFIVYRKEDDKVLKSVNYSPANLKQFINKITN